MGLTEGDGGELHCGFGWIERVDVVSDGEELTDALPL